MPLKDITEELEVVFEQWKQEIITLIAASGQSFEIEVITDKVNNLTYDQILDIFLDELEQHAALRNPHGMTLTNLGGMGTTAFNALTAQYFPRSGFPFTQVRRPEYYVEGSNVVIRAFNMMYLGRRITVPLTTLAVTVSAKRYIVIDITGPETARVATVSLSTLDTEDMNTIVIGHVTKEGTPLPVFVDVARIGKAVISDVPRGNAIPATTGTQTSAASLDTEWFATP